VKSSEAQILVNARQSIVWDILTDTGNVTVWASGITAIEGEMRDGGAIRIRTDGSKRGGLRMLPGEVIRWRKTLPLGLLRRTFTVILTSEAGFTQLRITHELAGLLSPFAG
jgi:hypothetical protein